MKPLSEQFNDRLDELGHFGPFQIKTFLLLAVSTMPCGWHAYSQTLLSFEPKYVCSDAKSHMYDPDITFDDYYKVAAPASYNLTTNNAQCKTFPYGSKVIFNSTSEMEAFNKANLDNLIECEPDNDFWFNTSDTISAVTEWQTVCSKQWQQDFDTQSFMLGKLAGAFIFGAMSDAIGRFRTYFISVVLQLVTGIMIAISPNIFIYTLMRFAEGAACSGVYLCAYVLALEFIGPEKRTTPGLVYHMFYAIGYSLLAPVGYFIKDFRTVSWVLALPSVLCLPLYIFIEESVQWLLGKGRHMEAGEIVMKAAISNGKDISTPVFEKVEDYTLDSSDEKKKSQCSSFAIMFVDVGKVISGPYPKLRKRIVSLFLIWMINSGTYYGITLNTKNLGGSFYVNMLISGLTEIPAITVLIFAIEIWDIGRKRILMGTYALCTVFMFIIGCIQTLRLQGSLWTTVIIILSMGGKFAISGAYAVIYLFSTEQVPTNVKNSCLGVCSIFARFGGLLCPYIISLKHTWEPIPMIIFGSVSAIAFLLMIPLPETHKMVLPQTLEEAEKFGEILTDEEEPLK